MSKTALSGHSTLPPATLTGLDDRQALRATRRAFKAFIDAKGWADLQDQPRLKVKRYVGDRAAVVDGGDKRVLVTSQLPLRSGTGKAKRPIDTKLENNRGRLRPAQPLSDFSLAPRAGTGSLIDFPRSDVKVTLDGTRNARGIRSGKSLIYPNAFPDADAILKSLPSSVGFAVSLRGPRAPVSYPVSLTLRPGDRLLATGPRARGARRGPSGGAVVLRSGRTVSTVSAPVAVDAAGKPLPVTTRISGDRLVYRLAHRNRKTVYPALLDPFVSEDQRYWFGAPPGTAPPNPNPIPDFNGWSYSVSGVGGLAGAQGTGAFGNGLNIFASSGLTYPPSGTIGTWTFQAPYNPAFEADGARIIKADFGYTAHVRSQGATSTMLQSIYNRQGTRTENGFIRGSDPNTPFSSYTPYPNTLFGFSQAASEGIAGNKATYPYRVHCLSQCNVAQPAGNEGLGSPGNQVRLGMLQNGGRPSVAGGVFMGSSLIMMTEQAAPRITTTGAPNPTAWTNAPFTINATVNDYGLGPNQASITAPNNAAPLPTATQGGACIAGAGPPAGGTPGSANKGDRNHRCTAPLSLQAPSSSLADGSYNVTVNATDILGTAGAAAVPVKLDRQPPTLTLSGSLYEARGKFIGPNQDHSLSVNATDGDAAPAVAQRSGVTSLTATLDGQPIVGGSAGAPCTRPEGSCGLAVAPVLTGAQIAVLDDSIEHTVVVTARDALGQARTESFTFRVDVTPPTSVLSDVLAEMNGRTLTEDGYRLRAEATDNKVSEGELDDEGEPVEVSRVPGAGLQDIVVRLDGASVSTSATSCFSDDSCDQARLWDWDTRGASNAVHVVSVTAADKVGNLDEQEFEVTLNRVADQPPRTNATIRRTIIGAALNDRAGSATAALGDINDDGFADYAVGAPGAGVTGRSAAGAAYIVMGASDASTIDLNAPGTAAVRILGPGSNQYCGTSVAALGDVNGDDIGDMAIGCPGVEPDSPLTQPVTGRVYVLFGRTDPQTVDLANLGTAGFVITGPADSLNLALPGVNARPAVFGERLATSPVGQSNQDVNDDGQADIVIGDSAVTRDGSRGTGAAYVIYGKDDANPVDVTALADKGFVIRGDHTGGLAGYSTAIIDDVTGDTLADVLVGAPGAAASTPGRAYVVSGAAMSDAGEITGADVDLRSGSRSLTLTSPDAGDRFGVNVAVLGDTDMDVSPDFAIGTRSGAFVVRKLPTSSRQLSVDDGFRVTGPANTVGLLSTKIPEAPIGPAEDLDGDEREDLIIGYPDAAGARAYTIRSPEVPRTIDVTALPGQRGSAVTAGPAGDRGGAAVAANGYQLPAPVTENAQSIVGAPQASGGLLRANAGKAYVVAEPAPSGSGVEPPPDESDSSAPAASEPSARGLAAPRAAADDRSFETLFPRPFGRFVADPVGTNTDSITVRNDFQFLVVGNLSAGGAIDVTFKEFDRNASSATNQGRMPAFYYFGYAYVAVRRCGWVVAYKTRRLEDQPSGRGRRCGRRRLPPRAFSRLINCDHCPDGSEVELRGHSRSAREELARRKNSSLLNPGRIPYWRNVQPGTREGLSPPSGYIDVRTDARRAQGKGPVRLFWRYLSRSKGRKFARFALVRAPADDRDTAVDEREPGLENNKWVFIERRWLPPGSGKNGLCDNTGGRTPGLFFSPPDDDNNWEGEILDYKTQPAENSRAEFNRVDRNDWPRVCSHKQYGVPTP